MILNLTVPSIPIVIANSTYLFLPDLTFIFDSYFSLKIVSNQQTVNCIAKPKILDFSRFDPVFLVIMIFDRIQIVTNATGESLSEILSGIIQYCFSPNTQARF